MKKHSILLFVSALCPLIGFWVLFSQFDGALALLARICNFHSAVEYQNTAFCLVIVLYICAMTGALLLPTALYHLQYELTPLSALFLAIRRYAIALITLPLFVMRFAGIDVWLPYLTNEGQIANPLYHPVIWRQCAEWGSLAMVIVVIFWACLLVMNLFGSLPYGYIVVNFASALCLVPMLYLLLDFAAVLKGQNLVLTALVLLLIVVVIWLARRSRGQNPPCLRPFFAQGEENERRWKEQKKQHKKWYDHK